MFKSSLFPLVLFLVVFTGGCFCSDMMRNWNPEGRNLWFDHMEKDPLKEKDSSFVCPNCGAVNYPGMRYCGKCGFRLPAVKRLETAAASQYNTCTGCGFKNPSDALYCTRCGKKLAPMRPYSPRPKYSDHFKEGWIVYLVGSLGGPQGDKSNPDGSDEWVRSYLGFGVELSYMFDENFFLDMTIMNYSYDYEIWDDSYPYYDDYYDSGQVTMVSAEANVAYFSHDYYRLYVGAGLFAPSSIEGVALNYAPLSLTIFGWQWVAGENCHCKIEINSTSGFTFALGTRF